MKKLIYTLAFVACLVLSITSCSKDESNTKLQEDNLVTITFSAEKAGNTKTAAVEGATSVSYIWTDEDIANIKLFKVSEGSVSEQVANPTVTKVSDKKLTISAEVEPNATYTFRAVLSKDYTGSGDNYAIRKPKVLTTQSPTGNSNFDPNADILVSDDVTVTVDSEVSTGAMELVFRRKVVVNKMTLKGLVEGEKVSRVTVTSDKDLTGYLSSTSNTANMTGQSKTLTLNYDNVAVPSSGQFPVYFVTMPNEGHTLTVDIITDQYTYTKTFGAGTINFNAGQFSTFGVTMPAGTPVVNFEDGKYAIANIDGNRIAKKYVSGNNLSNPLTVIKEEDHIICPSGTIVNDYLFTFTKVTESGDYYGMYTIKDNSGNYLYAAGTGTSNNLKAQASLTASSYWSVTKNADGSYDIIATKHSTNRNTMRYNTSGMFSCYGSGQVAITLYPEIKVLEDPTPIINVTSENPMAVSNKNDIYSIEYTITNPTVGTSLNAVSSVSWIHDIDCSTSGEVVFEVDAQASGAAARSGVITLSYGGAESVEVTVNQAAGEGGGGSTVKYFVEVSTEQTDYSGTYLIVCKTQKYIFDSSLSNLDSSPNYITVSGNLPEKFPYDTYKNYAVTIETYSTGYSILSSSNKYMGRSANSNGIDASTTLGANYVNTISITSSGVVEIVGKGGRKFNYNASSGKFRYFAASNTSLISLYKLVEVSE